MCTIDIILAACLLPALFEGLKKGFVKQIVDIATLIVGAWLSFRFSQSVSVWIAGFLPDLSPTLLSVVSFVLIFMMVMLVLGLLGHLLQKILKMATLGWADRILGLAFAILKGMLVMGIMIYLFEALNGLTQWVKPEDIAESKFYGPIKDFAGKVFPYFKSLLQEGAEILPNV